MIRVAAEVTEAGVIRLSVHDTGVGIDAEHFEVIFIFSARWTALRHVDLRGPVLGLLWSGA